MTFCAMDQPRRVQFSSELVDSALRGRDSEKRT